MDNRTPPDSPGPCGGATEKLVRDRIPDIIRSDGRVPAVRTADRAEYAGLLRAKLYEEVGEYAASRDPAELADVLEVLRALAALHGLTPEDLERERAAKEAARGSFTRRLVLQPPKG